LNTKINEENKIHIDGQLIGELKGLKFLIEITSKTLDTDIKSIKKAARKGVEEELVNRIKEILSKGEIEINSENKILWKGYPIARLKKGKDYLNPEIDIIADDSLNLESKTSLISYLNKWLYNYKNEVLGDLINLTKHEIKNQYLRGLVFQLYENNGVVKRSEIDQIVKSIPAEERKKLWGMGIKIGRYHIYLPKMLKPKAVEFRVNLWKTFYSLSDKNKIPQSGLNFLINQNFERNFLLLCGFEKFKEFYVRIDILEKLFIKIIDVTKDRKFKINAEMMNLLGCSKENFFKLMNFMGYKKDKTVDTYIFSGERKKRDKLIKFDKKENPFNKLLSLNIK
jgi:ATP-dependent RNA helicase SUPV3L1/SUV3